MIVGSEKFKISYDYLFLNWKNYNKIYYKNQLDILNMITKKNNENLSISFKYLH